MAIGNLTVKTLSKIVSVNAFLNRENAQYVFRHPSRILLSNFWN